VIYLILIILAVVSRLVPHIANIAPIGALALFVGTTSLTFNNPNKRMAAYLLPLVALAVSDAIIGFYTAGVMAAVYFSYMIIVGLGFLVRRNYHWSTIIAASLTGSVIFFLVTNAAVWAFTPMYTQSFAGLIDSYIAALPFLRNTIAGDLLFSGVLFGAYAMASRAKLVPQLRPSAA
jgi:hypothetical protein